MLNAVVGSIPASSGFAFSGPPKGSTITVPASDLTSRQSTRRNAPLEIRVRGEPPVRIILPLHQRVTVTCPTVTHHTTLLHCFPCVRAMYVRRLGRSLVLVVPAPQHFPTTSPRRVTPIYVAGGTGPGCTAPGDVVQLNSAALERQAWNETCLKGPMGQTDATLSQRVGASQLPHHNTARSRCKGTNRNGVPKAWKRTAYHASPSSRTPYWSRLKI